MQDPHIRSSMNDLLEVEKKGIQGPFEETLISYRNRNFQVKVELLPENYTPLANL